MADDVPEDGQSLLSRISTEMVRAQKEYFGKGPTQAKSYFLDDMLLIVMRGGITTAERTMLAFGQEDKVRDFRQTFENLMTGKLTGMIEELTGRKVLTYQSQIMFGPDRVVELFVFDDDVAPEPVAATPEHQQEIPPEQLEHPGREADMRTAPEFGEETYRGSGRLEE